MVTTSRLLLAGLAEHPKHLKRLPKGDRWDALLNLALWSHRAKDEGLIGELVTVAERCDKKGGKKLLAKLQDALEELQGPSEEELAELNHELSELTKMMAGVGTIAILVQRLQFILTQPKEWVEKQRAKREKLDQTALNLWGFLSSPAEAKDRAENAQLLRKAGMDDCLGRLPDFYRSEHRECFVRKLVEAYKAALEP